MGDQRHDAIGDGSVSRGSLVLPRHWPSDAWRGVPIPNERVPRAVLAPDLHDVRIICCVGLDLIGQSLVPIVLLEFGSSPGLLFQRSIALFGDFLTLARRFFISIRICLETQLERFPQRGVHSLYVERHRSGGAVVCVVFGIDRLPACSQRHGCRARTLVA